MSPARARPRRAKAAAKEEVSKPAASYPVHHLVPPHELLTEEEGQKTLHLLGTSVERLPKILVSDPGLRTDPIFRKALEAKEPLGGRLVRVRRPSPTAGEAVAYRVLVSGSGE